VLKALWSGVCNKTADVNAKQRSLKLHKYKLYNTQLTKRIH